MITMKTLLFLSLIPPILILVYPVISFIRYKFFSNPISKSENFLVPVSIIIACYNEEKFIRDKILSFLDKNEWIDLSEIIVVSAGSNDRTNSILIEFQNNPLISIIFSDVQLAKIEAVNLAVDYAKNDLLVFSDCRQRMKKGSLKQLIYNFNDESVGTVVAMLKDSDENKKQSFFRATINKLVYYDSQYSSGLSVYGALYAQRKSIFQKFPQEQLFDDLCVISTTLSQKMRLIQEPNAVIYDVNFQQYYGGERLERLTRGLLIFITKHWSQIIKINTSDLLRLLIFKYAKLLLPFSLIIWIVYIIIWFYTANSLIFTTLFILISGILFSIKKTRLFIFLGLRINFYFILAIFKFFFLKQRSTRWEKLKLSRN